MLSWDPSPEQLLHLLLWSAAILASALVLLVVAAGFMQVRADRRNRARIAAFQRWEGLLPDFVFGEGEVPEAFHHVSRLEQDFLRLFLQRFRAAIGGAEGGRLREVYLAAGLHLELPARLESRHAPYRASSAIEVWAFDQPQLLPVVRQLLKDPVPYVAHAAARALARSGDLSYAVDVLDWVATQDQFQQGRLAALLEDFGPELLPWMEARLLPPPDAGTSWRLYALLACTHRPQSSLDQLRLLLTHPDLEVELAAIKALAALGNPEAYGDVEPFSRAEDPVLRMQAAKALGVLGGATAVPDLLKLLADPSYEVRRHASLGLVQIGGAGFSALQWVVEDPEADPFARDMAAERLEWTAQRGRL